MKFLKRLLIAVGLCVAGAAGGLYATANGNYPPLKDGDVIFQTTLSAQSSAIFIASSSLLTHTGIIKKSGDDFVVIEAGATVNQTPIKEWISHGLFKRIAIYRDPNLTPEQAAQIISTAESYYGQPYDIFFSFDNGAIYCSELPYLSYKQVGIEIGKVQKLSELNFDNRLVKKLIEQRWTRHPVCIANHYNFEQCYDYVLNQHLITPASIARDDQFEEIYSNYPF